MEKRRFIITGGSGFLGQFLIRKLSSLYPESQIHNIDIHHPSDLSFSNLNNHIIDVTNQQSLKSFTFSENDIPTFPPSNEFLYFCRNILFNISTTVDLSIEMGAGWNWFSINAESDDMSLTNVLSSLDNVNGDFIKNLFSSRILFNFRDKRVVLII